MLTGLTVLLALMFVVTGGTKILAVPASLRIRDQLRLPAGLWHIIGVLEWLGAAGLLVGLAHPALGVTAAAALCLFMLGATASRLRVHDSVAHVAFDLGVFALLALDLVLQARA